MTEGSEQHLQLLVLHRDGQIRQVQVSGVLLLLLQTNTHTQMRQVTYTLQSAGLLIHRETHTSSGSHTTPCISHTEKYGTLVPLYTLNGRGAGIQREVLCRGHSCLRLYRVNTIQHTFDFYSTFKTTAVDRSAFQRQ